MNSRRLFPAALISALAAGAVAASPALAAPSEVTIEVNNGSDPNSLQGFVSSPRNACVPDRKVHLYYDSGGGFQRVGTDNKTSNNGRWRLYYDPNKRGGQPIPSGDYKAKVTRKVLGNGQCDADVSPTITVP